MVTKSRFGKTTTLSGKVGTAAEATPLPRAVRPPTPIRPATASATPLLARPARNRRGGDSAAVGTVDVAGMEPPKNVCEAREGAWKVDRHRSVDRSSAVAAAA